MSYTSRQPCLICKFVRNQVFRFRHMKNSMHDQTCRIIRTQSQCLNLQKTNLYFQWVQSIAFLNSCALSCSSACTLFSGGASFVSIHFLRQILCICQCATKCNSTEKPVQIGKSVLIKMRGKNLKFSRLRYSQIRQLWSKNNSSEIIYMSVVVLDSIKKVSTEQFALGNAKAPQDINELVSTLFR